MRLRRLCFEILAFRRFFSEPIKRLSILAARHIDPIIEDAGLQLRSYN